MRIYLLLLGVGLSFMISCSQKASEERMFHPARVDSSVQTQINEITNAIENGNPNPEWYIKRARLFLSLKNTQKAFKDLSTATAMNPALGEAYFWKAKIRTEEQQYEEAMKLMMQANAFNFYSPESEAILAETYVGLKQYSRALSHSSKAIKLRPGEAKYYVLLAKAQSGTGDTARALFNLNRALGRDSVFMPAYRELSAIYSARKLFDLAYPLVQKGIQKQPKEGFWWQQLGRFYLNHNLTDTALACFTRAVDLEPQLPEAYAGVGEAWYKKRQYSIALSQLLKAQELGLPLTEHNRWILATCLEWTGQKEAARPHYVFLTRKYPQNPRYSVALQRISRPVVKPRTDTLRTNPVF